MQGVVRERLQVHAVLRLSAELDSLGWGFQKQAFWIFAPNLWRVDQAKNPKPSCSAFTASLRRCALTPDTSDREQKPSLHSKAKRIQDVQQV